MLQLAPAGLDQVCLVSPLHLEGFVHDPLACLRTMQQKHGNLVAFAMAFHLCDRLPGPKNSAQRRLGNGLFNMNGERHDAQRRLLMPIFRKETVDGYVDVLASLADEMLASWHIGQTRDMAQEMKQLALRITSNVLFGLDE